MNLRVAGLSRRQSQLEPFEPALRPSYIHLETFDSHPKTCQSRRTDLPFIRRQDHTTVIMQIVVKFPPAQPDDVFPNESRILPTTSILSFSAAREPSITSMSIPHIFNAEAVDFRPARACVQKTTALTYNPMAAVFQPRVRSFVLNPEASIFLPQLKLDPEAAIFLPQSPPTQSTGQQGPEKVTRQKVTISFPSDTATISSYNNAECHIVQEKLDTMSNSNDCQDIETDPEPWVPQTSDSGTQASVEDLDSDTSTEDSVVLTESLTSSGFKFNAEAPLFVFKSNKIFTFDPEASEFVSKKQKSFAFNPQAASFVVQQGKPLCFDARAHKFIPTEESFVFNPLALEFVCQKRKTFGFNPEAHKFVSENDKPFVFNPEVWEFVSQKEPSFNFNPEACEFVFEEQEAFVFNPEAVEFAFTDHAAFSDKSENSTSLVTQLSALMPEACQVEPIQASSKLAPLVRQVEFEAQKLNMDYDDVDQDYPHQEQSSLPPLHHVGFFGHRVYTKSATTPATSLAIIRGTAKFQHITSFNDKNKLRMGCLIHNASAYIDPVIYRGDKTILERYSGSRLQDQVTGSTTKAYQDLGHWWEDTYYADEDMPELDPCNADEYQDTEVMFNGIMWNETAPSSNDIVANARATDDVLFKGAIERYNDAKERCRVGVGMSRLSQIVRPEDVVEPKRPSAAQLADEEARQKLRDLDTLLRWSDDVDDEEETMQMSNENHNAEVTAGSSEGQGVQDAQVVERVEAVTVQSDSASSSASDSGDTSRSPSPSPLTSEDGEDVVEDTKDEPAPTSLCKEAADWSDTAHNGDVVALSPTLVSHDNDETRITQADVGFSAEQEQDSALEATLTLRAVAAAAEIGRPLKPTKQLGLVPIPFMAPSTTEVDPGVKALYEAELHRICRISPPASRELPLRPNRLLLEGPTQPQPRSQHISPWALVRLEPGRLESQNLHALLLESEGNDTNDIFYRHGAIRPNTNTDTHPDDVDAAIVQPDTEQNGTVEAAAVEADTSERETAEARPETPSVSSTPPPAYRSTEDLTSPPPFEAAQRPYFTHHSTASSAQLPGISLLPQEPQTPPQVFDDAPVRSPRPRHEIHTLVDLPEDKVVDDFTPEQGEQEDEKQHHTNSGPRALLSRLGLGLAVKASKKAAPRHLKPVNETKVSWASLMQKAGHAGKMPTSSEEGTDVEDTALELRAKKSSWTYRSWKKCKKVVKANK